MILTEQQESLARAVMNNSYNLWGKKLASIPIEILDLDYTYQRLSTSTLKKLTKDWDNNECRFLLVSYRDGLFYIIDGQHRYKVAKKLGIKELPCEIYTGLSQAEEALIFSKQNDNVTKLTPYDTFKAKIASGMVELEDVKLDLMIKEVCDKYRITVQKGSQGKNLRAVSRVRSIVATQGKEGLEWIFGTAEDMNWGRDKETYSAVIIGNLNRIYYTYKENLDVVTPKLTEYITTNELLPTNLLSLVNETYPDVPQSTGLWNYTENLIKDILS